MVAEVLENETVRVRKENSMRPVKRVKVRTAVTRKPLPPLEEDLIQDAQPKKKSRTPKKKIQTVKKKQDDFDKRYPRTEKVHKVKLKPCKMTEKARQLIGTKIPKLVPSKKPLQGE